MPFSLVYVACQRRHSLAYAVITDIPPVFVLYDSAFWSSAYLLLIFAVSAWNGGGFYIEVFGRKCVFLPPFLHSSIPSFPLPSDLLTSHSNLTRSMRTQIRTRTRSAPQRARRSKSSLRRRIAHDHSRRPFYACVAHAGRQGRYDERSGTEDAAVVGD